MSAALLLRYSCGLAEEASAIEAAIDAVLAAGYHTADLRGDPEKLTGTRRLGELIAEQIIQARP